jgi:pilus assembly protein CpaD
MTTKPVPSRAALLFGALFWGLLPGGCVGPDAASLMQQQTANLGRVDAVTADVPVAIDRTTGRISEAGRADALVRFGGFAAGPTTHVTVAEAGLAPAARAGLGGLVEQAGIPRGNIDYAPARVPPGGPVLLHLSRFVVTPSDCPGWDDIQQNYVSNAPTVPLGCITNRNLQLMVEDPRDLVVGRATGPADGIREAGAVARYELDRVKPFLGTTATGAQGAGMSLR